MPGRAFTALYPLAEAQLGFVTTNQAATAGIGRQTLAAMVQRGTLERRGWGLYRLVHFPKLPGSAEQEAVLWLGETAGALSHVTALQVADACPPGLARLWAGESDRVDLTVPTGIRLRRAAPASVRLHRATLAAEETTTRGGLTITTGLRTIRDLAAAGLDPQWLGRAILQARGARLLLGADADMLARTLCGATLHELLDH